MQKVGDHPACGTRVDVPCSVLDEVFPEITIDLVRSCYSLGKELANDDTDASRGGL